MTNRAAVLVFAAAVSLLAAEDRRGLKPRPNAGEYPSVKTQNGVTIAARVLTGDEVRSGFVTDLERRYAVIEVAVYPSAGKAVEISDIDVSLRYDGRSVWTRAASPATVAGVVQRRNGSARRNSDVMLYPSIGIGHSTGPDYGDGRRGGGTTVGTGVGVGIGGAGSPDPPPASTDTDRRVMERELAEKALPTGRATAPVAGYLYFPLPQRKTVVAEELEFDGEAGNIRLPLRAEPDRTK
jgi:hypothetical protein